MANGFSSLQPGHSSGSVSAAPRLCAAKAEVGAMDGLVAGRLLTAAAAAASGIMLFMADAEPLTLRVIGVVASLMRFGAASAAREFD